MLCEPLAMASVFQSLAISEPARSSSSSSSSSYGARTLCSFNQRPSYLKFRDLQSPSHSNSLIYCSNGQLSLSVVTTAEVARENLSSSAQEGAQETSDTTTLSSPSSATKSPSLPIRYVHLKELFLQLCEGADVLSAMDPWLQKLTLSDWNQLLLQCGRQDSNIGKKILVLFRQKEAVLNQDVLFSKRNKEQALSELCKESDIDSSEEMEDHTVETAQGATLQEEQDGSLEHDLEASGFQDAPSLKLYTTLARVLTRQKRYDEVDLLETEVKEAGLKPNVHYYNVLLDSYTQRRLLSKGIELLRQMKSLGFEPHMTIIEKVTTFSRNLSTR
ncbi:hypothetical protein L7F22_039577 [Adiantum nelumboides]|nr:hypothetical protein [Adiantum nelumboides]